MQLITFLKDMKYHGVFEESFCRTRLRANSAKKKGGGHLLIAFPILTFYRLPTSQGILAEGAIMLAFTFFFFLTWENSLLDIIVETR